jgi:chromosomal replication initiator protein
MGGVDPRADRPLDGFLVGPENRLAHSSVHALARGEPGISPLVIHGPSGVGKTRLLDGLATLFLGLRPDAAVSALTAEAFASHCASARTIEDHAEVRGRFRQVDLFTLDDVQALDRAPFALEELEATVDALDMRGAAIAVAARTAPGQWTHWPARLVSRFRSGLAAGLAPPGVDAKRRYLLERSRARGATLAADAADRLAEAADGFRTLDGWLANLLLASKANRRVIGRAQVESLLAGPDEPASPDLDQIARAVAARFGLSPRSLRSAHRGQMVVQPRHLAIYLARRFTGLSFAAIGDYFGGRDTKTVRHACQMAERRIAADPMMAAAAGAIGQSWSPVLRGPSSTDARLPA